MPRLHHHSASSISLARACLRAWWYCYVEHRRPPDLTWEQIEAGVEHTPRQRSLALGKAVHAVLERWYLGKDPGWASFPGQIALSGAHLLPHPSKCTAHVERAISVPRFAGYIDLDVHIDDSSEVKRLGPSLDYANAPRYLIDYKTSSDPKWVKTSADLEVDVQANLYAYDMCTRYDMSSVVARWVYFGTKSKRWALPVTRLFTRDVVFEAVEGIRIEAVELDAIASIDEAPCNTAHCGAYGGCPYHVDRGGPCVPPAKNLGAWIQARNPKGKDIDMGSFADRLNKHKESQAAALAPPPAPPPEPVPLPSPEPAPAPPPAPKRGRKPGAAKITSVASSTTLPSDEVTAEITFRGPLSEITALAAFINEAQASE